MLSLTVFCPVFKGAKFIKGYMENMVEQTIFDEVDFFILDCASPENEFDTIKGYLSYPNITYERLDKDPGIYACWNHCIKNTRSDLLSNWNVDDRKTPWSLESLRNCFLLDDSCDLAYGRTWISNKENETWDETPSTNPLFHARQIHNWKELLQNNDPHCMPVWRRNLHNKFGYFDESYRSAADSDMWIRCAKGGARLQLVDEIVGVYYDNPEGISTKKENLRKNIEEVIRMRKKHDPEYKGIALPL